MDLNNINIEVILGIIIIIIAFITLFVIIIFEIKRDRDNKIALFNSLLEELRHNINMSDIFVIEPSVLFIKELCHTLEELYGKKSNVHINRIKIILKKIQERKYRSGIGISIENLEKRFNIEYYTSDKLYPNPSEEDTLPLNINVRKLFLKYFIPNTLIPLKLGEVVIEYQTCAIENALSSGTICNIIGKRPAKNLGHLYYSLKRMNLHKKRFAENKLPENWHDIFYKALILERENPKHQMIYEYWMWVHFRLWFLYLDLLLSSKTKLVHHYYINNI